MPNRPMVYFIGAGPGDPGLITMRGVACLGRADVVVYDRLVHPSLLRHARPDAERIDVGRAAPQGTARDAIAYLLLEKVRDGKRVARLKWGDPFVFDDGGEEALFLHEHGVPFEVVPGVPAAIGGPAYAGVAVTYCGAGDTLTLVRGHEDASQEMPHVDWASLARLDGTIVCYAGPRQLPVILAALLTHGRPADEPVALIYNGLSRAVMMASPADLEDFAHGFSPIEGLIASRDELHDAEVFPVADGIELRPAVSSRAFAALKQCCHTLAGRTGRGLCGTDSPAQVQHRLPQVPTIRVLPAALAAAQRGLRGWQAVQQLTGASHAAAWCGPDGEVRLVREDVGRDTALDKLVGAMQRSRVIAAAGFICITSRASFEMVQKAALAGAGVLAAVSAPTALAVDTRARLLPGAGRLRAR